ANMLSMHNNTQQIQFSHRLLSPCLPPPDYETAQKAGQRVIWMSKEGLVLNIHDNAGGENE
ncbi:MAG: hypothetical protein ACM3UW_02735, partial [Bacillota bacterium]